MMRLTTYYAASIYAKGKKKHQQHCSICKYKVTEMAKAICDKCLQLFGGSGYITGNTIERLYRDIRIMPVIGGHSDLMKTLIAMSMDI